MSDVNDNVIVISDTDEDDNGMYSDSNSFKTINVPVLLQSPSKHDKPLPVPPEVLQRLNCYFTKIRIRLEKRVQSLQGENRKDQVSALLNFIEGFSLVDFNNLLFGWSSTTYTFYVNFLRDTLPDPRNMSVWKKSGCGVCMLCGRSSSGLIHVLSACPTSLNEGRYSYRHDIVLGIIREAVSLTLTMICHGQSDTQSKLLRKSNDWQILMDKKYENYLFPKDLFVTNLRPDILVYSKNLKSVVIVELSIPWENYVASQHLKKTKKYAHIIEGLEKNGFIVNFYALEVSIQGIPTKCVYNFLTDLGLQQETAVVYLNRICKKTVQASHYIWVHRASKWDLNSNNLVPYNASESNSSDSNK